MNSTIASERKNDHVKGGEKSMGGVISLGVAVIQPRLLQVAG